MLAQRGPFSRFRPTVTFANAPTQAEATSWQAQVVTNGGAVSGARFIIVNNFIAAEKTAGTWALTDDYWGLWAEDTIGALTSLKQRRMGGTFSAPSFVPSRGYSFDGSTNYMNTLFVPSTMAVAMTGTNLRVAVYERTDVNAATIAMGSTTTSTNVLNLFPRTGATMLARLIANANVPFALLASDSRGYSAISSASATLADQRAYKNGIALAQNASAPSFGAGPSTFAIYIGAGNSTGTAATFRAASIGFACVGASLTATQEQAQYNNVQAWATAVGANV